MQLINFKRKYLHLVHRQQRVMILCHKFIFPKNIVYLGLKILIYFDKLSFLSCSFFKAEIKKKLLNSILKSSLKGILFLHAWYKVIKIIFSAKDKANILWKFLQIKCRFSNYVTVFRVSSYPVFASVAPLLLSISSNI